MGFFRRRPALAVSLAAGLVCALTVVAWMRWSLGLTVETRVPLDLQPMFELAEAQLPSWREGTLTPGPGRAAELPGRWVQFRGADRTNVVRDAPSLAASWPQGGLSKLWSVEVGEGYAGPAVNDGSVFLLDYDPENDSEVVRRLSLADGREIWRYSYSVRIRRNHGFSRTIPAVTDEYVVTLGALGHVHCLEAETGELVWRMDMVEEFGTVIPDWYTGQCPLLDGDAVVLAPGGEPLMMKVELATGEVLWETPNPGGRGMTHSSVAAMDHAAGRQYIYCTTESVVGVDAEDGRLLWEYPGWRIRIANIPTPVVIDEEHVFLSGGYNSGAMMLRLRSDGGEIEPEEVWRLGPREFGSDQQTPIFHDGHIYGVIPSGELACMDLEGNVLWTSTRARRFGLGPFLLADGKLLALDDRTGDLFMVEAVPGGYNELDRVNVLEPDEPWAPLALVGERLILRNMEEMVCVALPTEGGD